MSIYARSTLHNEAVRAIASELRFAGLRVATEVGVDGGRIDLVVLDGDRWAWLIEVKAGEHRSTYVQGLKQLRRYASVCGHEPEALTLVVPGASRGYGPDPEKLADAWGIDIWTCDFNRLIAVHDNPARPPADSVVRLPKMHPATAYRLSREGLERWARFNRKAVA